MKRDKHFRLWVLALCIAAVQTGCRKPGEHIDADAPSAEESYDLSKDPLVNPPSLLAPPPQDRSLIATNEVLYCSLDGNPSSLNPLFQSSTYDQRVNGIIFDAPFTFDKHMKWKINDYFVDSYEEAADRRSAILKLKPGLTWHDGQPFNAHDIEFSYHQIMDPEVPCPSVKSGTDQIERCVALDDLTVKFVHRAPLATNKWNILFPLIPKHLFEKSKEDDPTLKRSDYHIYMARHPVGNGPYKFVEWIENDKIVLERWDDFPGPKPAFKRLVYRIIPDNTQALFAFEKQEIDEIRLSGQQFAKDTQTESFKNVGVKAYGQQWSLYYIGWNQDGSNPFFKDQDVRVAMCHAFDYDRILLTVYLGLYPRSHGMYHPEAPMFNPDIQLYNYDLARAADLLDRAGWLVDSDDGWRYKDVETKSGDTVKTKFEFTLNLPQGSPTAHKLAAIFQEDLYKIGVAMKTRVIEWSTFRELNFKHDFQAQTSAWGTGTHPDTGWNLWRTESYENGRNYGGYSNVRVDELFELARHEFDEEKRMKYYAEASKLIYEDAPYLFLCNAPILWGFNKRISGVQFSPRGVINFSPAELGWWVGKGKALHDSAPN
ncbi:MAG: hypothetical protein IID39_01310 [Planctomycetes bacterium]|nr:hypothetical protein [Planctomycetota bacterium]